MLWVSLGLVTVLGGTDHLVPQRDLHQWKPSVPVLGDGPVFWLSQPGVPARTCCARSSASSSAADRRVAAPEFAWVAFFAFMGLLNPLRGLQLQHRHLGELQAVRRHRPDASVHGGPGPVHQPPRPGRGHRAGRQTRARAPFPPADIEAGAARGARPTSSRCTTTAPPMPATPARAGGTSAARHERASTVLRRVARHRASFMMPCARPDPGHPRWPSTPAPPGDS